MDHQVKSHKTIARFVAVLGILPGVWFLIATKTQLGGKLQITCGYWMVALVLLTVVWVMYAILTKVIMRSIVLAHANANSLNEARHYKLLFLSTIVETTIASAIVVLSLLGFLVTDLQCYLSRI